MIKMSNPSEDKSQRPRFRLFIPGTPKTYKEAAVERLVKVSQTQNDEEDDPCAKKEQKEQLKQTIKVTVGNDPRFQQQNQTLRCFVMYTDFFRCEKILGEGHATCTYFEDVYKTICPNDWISHWDDLRSKDLLPWSKAYLKDAERVDQQKAKE